MIGRMILGGVGIGRVSVGVARLKLNKPGLREEVRPIKSEIAIYDFTKYDFAKYINFQYKTH